MRLTSFSVATFNLYNLNEPGLPIYGDAGGWSAEEHERKIAWTAAMLRAAPAELYGFQELWHPDSLAKVLDRAGLAASHAAVVPPWLNGRHIACAAAVRRDLLDGEPEWIVNFPPGLRLQSRGEDQFNARISVTLDAFSRPVLHLRIRPRRDRDAIHVFVCHFKSKGPTEIFREPWYKADEALHRPHAAAIGAALSTIRRTAEATALRVILTDLMKDTRTPVIVLGDLNDDHNSNTLNILTEQPLFLRPLSLGGRDTALYSGQALQELISQRDVYYTYIHQGVHGSLDHVLVSEEFYANSRKRLWSFDSLEIHNDHLNGDDRKAAGVGDHGLVRVRLKWAPA